MNASTIARRAIAVMMSAGTIWAAIEAYAGLEAALPVGAPIGLDIATVLILSRLAARFWEAP